MQASGSSEDFVEQSPQKTQDRKTKKKDRLRVAQERKERANERERRELEKKEYEERERQRQQLLEDLEKAKQDAELLRLKEQLRIKHEQARAERERRRQELFEEMEKEEAEKKEKEEQELRQLKKGVHWATKPRTKRVPPTKPTDETSESQVSEYEDVVVGPVVVNPVVTPTSTTATESDESDEAQAKSPKKIKVLFDQPDPDMMEVAEKVFGMQLPDCGPPKVTAEGAQQLEDRLNAERLQNFKKKQADRARRLEGRLASATPTSTEAQLPHAPPTNFDTVEAEDALRRTLSSGGSDAQINMEVEFHYDNDNDNGADGPDNDGQSEDDVPLARFSKASTANKVIVGDKNMVDAGASQSQSDVRGTDESNTTDESVIGTRKRKKFTRKRGPKLPAPSAVEDFRNKVIKLRDQTETKYPETLYCFVGEKMDKEKIKTVAEKYIVDKLDTGSSQNRQTEPIHTACYVLKQLPNETKAQQEVNRLELRDCDTNDWLDNTQGGLNKPGDNVIHRQYYQKLGPTRKNIKNQDAKRQKHVFTLNEPYNLNVIHYLGDNFDSKEQYLAKHTGPVEGASADGAEGVTPEELPIATEVTQNNTGNEDDPPHVVDCPSEAETEDGMTSGRRVRMPREGDEVPEEYARPRYSLSTRLQPSDAKAIINAYADGRGKVLNGPGQYIVKPQSSDVYVFSTRGLGDNWNKTILKDTLMWGGDNKTHNYDLKMSRLAQNIKMTDPATGKKKTTNKFQRIVYHDGEESRIAVIQYLGDNEVAVSEAHGNTQSTDAQPFVPTSDRVRFDITKVGLTRKPTAVYRDDHSKLLPGTTRNIGNIRNPRQVTFPWNDLIF